MQIFFFQLFVTDEVMIEMVNQTNSYAHKYLNVNNARLSEASRMKMWVDMDLAKMKKFVAMTFYMGILKKENVKHYWSTDPVLSTRFARNLLTRNEYHNIMSYLHLVDNITYIPRGEEGYEPKKKLGLVYTEIVNNFHSVWIPRQNLALDEGTIGFKGRCAFKVYNPNKPEKYG